MYSILFILLFISLFHHISSYVEHSNRLYITSEYPDQVLISTTGVTSYTGMHHCIKSLSTTPNCDIFRVTSTGRLRTISTVLTTPSIVPFTLSPASAFNISSTNKIIISSTSKSANFSQSGLSVTDVTSSQFVLQNPPTSTTALTITSVTSVTLAITTSPTSTLTVSTTGVVTPTVTSLGDITTPTLNTNSK